jgi:hypothetical protein
MQYRGYLAELDAYNVFWIWNVILGEFGAEKRAYNYSTSRDASAVLNSSISYLDWTTELAGAKLAMYI